jgi:hypothetical protein
MSSWAQKRQLTYLGGVVVVIMLAVFFPLYTFLSKEPTCFDGKQNGVETGIDCGGVCSVRCPSEIADPIVHWVRSFKVGDGVYDIAALVENINSFGASEVLYQFRAYDEKNLLIQEHMGKTFALPNDRWIIFSAGIDTGKRIPNRVFIDFLEKGTWVSVDLSESDVPMLRVAGQYFEERDGKPRLSATIANESPFAIDAIEVVALISDKDENVLGVSRTYIETLPKYGEKTVVFTWREPFVDVPAEIDIFPRVNYVSQ